MRDKQLFLQKNHKNLLDIYFSYNFAAGEMAEWSIAAVLKTVEPKGSGGSNPSLSAETSLIFEAGFLLNFMEYFVYAISSLYRNYIYVGLTSNITNRFHRHNSGYEKTTKPYAPFELIYTERCKDRKEAREREKYWKSGIGKEKLKQMKPKGSGGLSADR